MSEADAYTVGGPEVVYSSADVSCVEVVDEVGDPYVDGVVCADGEGGRGGGDE